MDIRQHLHGHAAIRTTFARAGLLGLLLPALCLADGARVGQKAKPGEIVVTRNVAARPADRPATAPGIALLVSSSPNPQLVNTTTGNRGPGEITDAEIADLNAGPGSGGVPTQNNVQRSLNTALAANDGGNSVKPASGSGVSNPLSAPTMGSGVADSTHNISAQVTAAVGQIPLLGAGH